MRKPSLKRKPPICRPGPVSGWDLDPAEPDLSPRACAAVFKPACRGKFAATIHTSFSDHLPLTPRNVVSALGTGD